MSNLIAQRRSTAAAVLKAFEGELKKPTNGTQFLAIQPDFSLTPNFSTTENVELKDDIMSGKTIVTGEAPTGTISHYVAGSGTAGTPPEYSSILQATFGGFRSLTSEQTLAAGSTTSVLKFASAAAASSFKKGDAAFIKDTANGWAVRPVESVSGTDVTLGFNLEKAPATAVKVGAFATYFPLSDNIPVFDMWHYIGAGESGVENIANCRVTSMSVTANAKDLINATYSFEGTQYRFNQDFTEEFRLFSYNNKLTVVNTQGGTRTETEVVLTAQSYATGAALATEIQSKVSAITGLNSFRATFASNRFSFTSTAAYLFDFSKGGETPEGAATLADVLGFESADVSSTAPSTGTKASTKDARLYRDYSSKLTEVYDETDPVIARGQQIFIGDAADNICIDSSSVSISINTPKQLITSICRESGNYRSLISARSASVTVSAHLQDDDRRFFEKFQDSDTTQFALIAGKKNTVSGKPQWKAGETFVFYGSPASITSWSVTGSNDVYMLDLELTCFSPGDGTGSIFLSYV